MAPKTKKMEIGIFIAALIALVAIWAINGFDDTWFYASAAVIAIPVSWFYFGKKNKE